jgi:hypothetical protein
LRALEGRLPVFSRPSERGPKELSEYDPATEGAFMWVPEDEEPYGRILHGRFELHPAFQG